MNQQRLDYVNKGRIEDGLQPYDIQAIKTEVNSRPIILHTVLNMLETYPIHDCVDYLYNHIWIIHEEMTDTMYRVLKKIILEKYMEQQHENTI